MYLIVTIKTIGERNVITPGQSPKLEKKKNLILFSVESSVAHV